MYINGSLLEALQGHIGNPGQIALLIIDESNAAVDGVEVSNTPGHADPNSSNITAYQQRLLMFMQKMGCHVWSIRFLQAFPAANGGPDNTRTELKGFYNGNENLLRKPNPNAFNATTLHNDLGNLGVNRVVIMGWHANACVHATVGNQYWGLGMDDGATHLGYATMSCDQILHGGPANWSNANPIHYGNLEFYSAL